jgi:hypothetical protein
MFIISKDDYNDQFLNPIDFYGETDIGDGYTIHLPSQCPLYDDICSIVKQFGKAVFHDSEHFRAVVFSRNAADLDEVRNLTSTLRSAP